ncbi:MAG: SUF system Fe-S cluster assembly protein [Robiginitomaculum sp.]|nr:MAG: SUF system Fe-S cluster assembly protein [Robiginitomaculum sp.]
MKPTFEEKDVDEKVRDTIDIGASANVNDEPSQPVSESATQSALPQEELDRLTTELIAAFKTVFDPEIPVDVYELGLIYKVDVSDDRDVEVDMTLTAPGCPVAGDMVMWVENAAASVTGVRGVTVNLTFEPPWDPSRMSDEARLELNMF